MTVKDYNQAVNQYADGVFRFILKNVRDEHLARDIVQDSYEKLWMHVKEIPAEKVKSYLYKTAYHRMVDLIRKEKRHQLFEQDQQFSAESLSHDQYSDVGEILNQAITF